MGGASHTANLFELPFDPDSVRLLVVVQPGTGRAGGSLQMEAERELENFDIRLDASKPTVGEAKEAIERHEGTKKGQQLLFRVKVSSDESNVREFDH